MLKPSQLYSRRQGVQEFYTPRNTAQAKQEPPYTPSQKLIAEAARRGQLAEMADRTQELTLPTGVSLEKLINDFALISLGDPGEW
jgi:hypothetical protein